MDSLPIVVGFGGINAAGRSSFHHMYNRLIIDSLNQQKAEQTCIDLAMHMTLIEYKNGVYLNRRGDVIEPQKVMGRYHQMIREHTLIRRIEKSHFDVDAVPFHRRATLAPTASLPITFLLKKENLPAQMPIEWQCVAIDDNLVEITVNDNLDVYLPQTRTLKVQSAAQLPSGFEPGKLYASTHHPRALQMAVYAASDAIQSIGIPWEDILRYVSPDHVSVYAGSLMGQMDDYGSRGMMTAWLKGEELTSKQFSLGLVSMPTDFINSYVLGHVGTTATHQGACATFLYNLEHAVQDIRSGKSRVAVVGSAEAPITAEIIEALRASGALAEDEQLIALDKAQGALNKNSTLNKNVAQADYRRASRPFNDNCGFVCGESAQYLVLFDDRLAMELGAQIYGAIPSVYINADGFKKSITQPGIGNYITLAKSVNTARQFIGEKNLGQRTFIQAHGSSTPLNRVTESHVFDKIAETFSLHDWSVTAVKAYLGHSMSAASGDQLAATFGVWSEGYIPGIFTLDKIADDVHRRRIHLFQQHKEVGTDGMDAAFINSKGFGGNNATALVLAPHVTKTMLEKRYGQSSMTAYRCAAEQVQERANHYNDAMLKGEAKPIYHFGKNSVSGEDLDMTKNSITIPGYEKSIDITNHIDF